MEFLKEVRFSFLSFSTTEIFSAQTPPGTKLRLVGKIPMENGMLLINETNCQVLGGNVPKMIEKWNMEKVSLIFYVACILFFFSIYNIQTQLHFAELAAKVNTKH